LTNQKSPSKLCDAETMVTDFYKYTRGLLEANEEVLEPLKRLGGFIFIKSDVQSNGKCICSKGGVNGQVI